MRLQYCQMLLTGQVNGGQKRTIVLISMGVIDSLPGLKCEWWMRTKLDLLSIEYSLKTLLSVQGKKKIGQWISCKLRLKKDNFFFTDLV